MSKLLFLNDKGEKLFEDTGFGNKQDLSIVIKSPTEVTYPFDFNMFVDSVRAQKKLQKTLGNTLKIIIDKKEYNTIAEVNFVSLEIRLEVGQGKLQKNILIPFVCPIDLVLAEDIIKRINED